jgi:hypothetical protein
MRLNQRTLIFVVVLAVIIVAAAVLLRRAPDATTGDDAEATSEPQALFPDITADMVSALSITRTLTESDATPTANTVLTPLALRLALDASGMWVVEGEELSAEVTPEATAETTAEATADVTAEATTEATAEATVESTAETTVEAESTVEAEATEAESTAEATAEATADAVAEVTPEATPLVREIDQTRVAQAISTLIGLRYRDSFETDNLAQFGLDTPAYDVNFTANGTNYRLQIGDKNIGGTQYYALLGDDGIVYILTSSSSADIVLNLLNTSPYVVPPTPTPIPVLNAPGPLFMGFDAQVINTFTLSDSETGQELVLVRNPETREWSIEGSDAAVQQQLVDFVLGQFGTLSAIDKVPGANLEALGLVNPTRFILANIDETTNYIVALGNTDPTGTRYYARVNDYADIAVVETALVDFVFDMLENPPVVPEVTPEVTAEATAESTAEATVEATAEATESSGD